MAVNYTNLRKDGFKDFQLGVMFSSPNQVTKSGIKREHYITISLGYIQMSVGKFEGGKKLGGKKRRNLLC